MHARSSAVFAARLFVSLMPFVGSALGQPDLTSDEIDRISKSVVRIVALQGGEPYSTGSGTLVDPSGRIYTNRHVIEEADDYVIELLENPNELPVPRYRASLVGYSMDIDFAVLQIDRTDEGGSTDISGLDLPFLDSLSSLPRRGDEVFVFGYPSLGEGYLALTKGTVTTIRNGTMNEERMAVWYQTDAQISPGNSGGLAIDAAGGMIGIPTSVLSEDRTGGRLGGILAFSAVSAALVGGLEADRSRIENATSAPVIAGGTLDYNQMPTFGEASLEALFAPDPYKVEVVSGGEVAANYLGGACTGFAAVAPDFRLNWNGNSDELRFFFVAADGGDTTLLVNLPDGSWICNDDGADTVDPMVGLSNPQEGQYDIWVGSYSAGGYVSGTLHVTERELDPTSAGPTELDYSASPSYGSISLAAGFTPDPHSIKLTAGGTVDVASLGGECVGNAAQAPDIRMQWTGVSEELRFFFRALSGDTSLVINLPDGSWICNDDVNGTLDPMVVLSNPRQGQYDIWVATYRDGDFISGELNISERNLGP